MDKKLEEQIIQSIISKGIVNIDSLFEKFSLLSYQVIGIDTILKGYIFNKKDYNNELNSTYIYFIYLKLPGKLYYYFSEDSFNDLSMCKIDITQKMKLFPLFGFRKSNCLK